MKDALKEGDKIPDFSLRDQNGDLFDIKNVLGRKNLVIYFYPKDGSPGCTRQACNFRDQSSAFDEADAIVIGISGQSVASHREFAETNDLTFPLLSDTDNKVRRMFGVPSSFFGIVPGRVTYVVNKEGRIVYIYNSQSQVERHVDEALKVALVLKKSEKAMANVAS
jgi:peroxiredoxin Q/BCP